MQLIQIRRSDHRVAVTGQVTVPLVVGHDEDDMGTVRENVRRRQAQQDGDQKSRLYFHWLIFACRTG